MGGSIIHERKPAKWLTFILAFTDPFSEIDDTTKVKVLETICNHCKVLFFPIHINCNKFSYYWHNSVSDLPKIGYKNDLWKKRYRYQLTPKTGRLQLWDVESASYADFHFITKTISRTKVLFKGISIEHTPELDLNGISLFMDIYGMDAKNSITIDRESFTEQGRRTVCKLMQDFKNAFIDIILDKLKSNTIKLINQYSKKEKFNPYTFWLICDTKQRESIPKHIISSIVDSAVVILKVKDQTFQKDTRCVANILPDIEKQVFYWITHRFRYREDEEDDSYNILCRFLDEYTRELEAEQIVVDHILIGGLKKYWGKTIQNIGNREKFKFY